jgi:hypothetical protein
MSSINMCLLPWATLHSDSEEQEELLHLAKLLQFHVVRAC